jgi:FHA domain
MIYADMDLDNNPEFQQFLQSQNQTAAAIAYIEEQVQPEIERGFATVFKATMMAMQKLKDDSATDIAAAAVKRSSAATATATATATAGGTNGNAGKPCTSTVKPACGKRNCAAKAAPNTQLSKSVKPSKTRGTKKVTASTNNVPVAAGEEIPQGVLRIEVGYMPSLGDSPHVCYVKPLPPKAPQKEHCKIGRSRGNEFKQFGVSLPMDLEVSTKHGVIHRVNKDFYYKDLESANGTTVVATDIMLQPLVPFKLENGMELVLGKSTLKFTFAASA